MPTWIPCAVCSEMTSAPIAVRTVNPETGRPVDASVCDEGCERTFRAHLAELEPADAPPVAVEVELEG